MMITEIEDYFSKGCGRCDRFGQSDCSTQLWNDGLAALREICLSLPLVEMVKWGHPCYTSEGRNIAILGAFRGDYRITFFNAALLKDPEGVLEKQGPNTAHAGMIRFTDAGQVKKRDALLRSYLLEAISYAKEGLMPPKEERSYDLPAELIEALEMDIELAEAFNALTPGRQRSYIISIGSAKKSETRKARVVRYRAKILMGKGAMER